MNHPSLVLASTSPYRRELLARLGVPFVAVGPGFEEAMPAGADPGRLVMEQAEGKAHSVAAQHPGAVIIGSDQVAALDDTILGKPGTAERAVEQLRLLRGNEHRLLTAVAVVDSGSGRLFTHLETTLVRVRALTDAEIEGYVRRENPIDCAGSYRVEALGISIFEYLRGDDPTAIVGLPLIAVCRLLRELGVSPLVDPT